MNTLTSLPENVVETDGLTKRFGERAVVRDVELRVPRGVAFGYLGPNGAGKTTLIRMLLGLTPASAGEMRLLGLPVPAKREQALARVGAIVEEPLDGVEATRRLVDANTRARILVLTTFDLDEYVHAAIRAGANGFLLKDVQPAELVAAIQVVAAGNALFAPAATQRLLDRFATSTGVSPADESSLDQLTEREREILRLIANGLSNAELATQLHLSETTVKTHVSSMLRKLGVRDRVQAVIAAYDAGLVHPGT
jgi:DNA-binding NarL/FixJ family response regulator